MFEGSSNVLVVGGTFHQESHMHSPPDSPSAIPGFERLLQAASPAAFYNSGERFSPPKCHPNTRHNVLQKITDWIDDAESHGKAILWMNGDAGIGKSAIARILAERLAEEEHLLASFFFSKDDSSRNNASRFVPSITYQLVQHFPPLMEHVIRVLDRNPLILNLSPDTQFPALITAPICGLAESSSAPTSSLPRAVIIDGLDKCQDSNQQILILETLTTALQKRSLPLLFFITACPEGHLLERFASDPLKALSSVLQLNDLFVHSNSAEEVQIINSRQEFSHGLGQQIIKWDMNNVGVDYEVVAIIGSQSSGKSTLLNNLFGTNFVVMDPHIRGRTTNGIWLSRDETHNILVMDVEGSDSGSRRDDRDFERKAALFALACSRLLIVNIWENQVGLFNGANLALLKTIFEEHLYLYGTLDRRAYCPPKILFVIQAHTSGTSLKSLARTITQDLKAVWNEIEKPEALKEYALQNYFDLDFESLSHLTLTSQLYTSQVNSLRERFVDKRHPNYLFKEALSNSVPTEGLDLYMKTTWSTIRSDGNLNLPGQHELLAYAMCDKISTTLKDEFISRVASQNKILQGGTVVDGLGTLMRNWQSELLARYDDGAHRYLQSVYARKRGELMTFYQSEAFKLFSYQLRNLRATILFSFDAMLEDANRKDDQEFLDTTERAAQKYEGDFAAALSDNAIPNASWDWRVDCEGFRSELLQKIEACKNERKGPPLEKSKAEMVASSKSMRTRAVQHRDGRLVVEVHTDCGDRTHGLRGRVLIVVRNQDHGPIGVTNPLRCTTRGGLWDPFTPSSSKDVFTVRFPREIGMRARDLEIHQTDESSLGGVFHSISQIADVVVAV